MNIYTIIITEFLLISSCILLLFKLRARLGLAPLYILLGAVQYLQANLGSSLSFNFFDEYVIYPGSIILFSGILFAVLLIYIKEGVASARTLIIGIVFSNIIMSLMFEITYLQQIIDSQINNTSLNSESIFNINFNYLFSGTVILFIDFLLLVILYQYLILKFKKLPFFLILLISLWSILIFDAVAFNIAIFYGTPLFKTSLLSHLLGKSIAAIIYSIILYLYVKYLDNDNETTTFIANQERDIFSIIKYRKKYEDLKIQKKIDEKKLTSQIEITLNNISDGFVSLDTNWCYTYVNKKAGEFLGRTPSSLIGKHIWTEFPEGVGLPFYMAYYKAVETQQTQYFQEYFEPFGKWFDNRVYPSSKGLTIYFTDITEQKKAEKLLIESKDYLDNIINNIGDPVFVKDDQSRLLVVNDAFCKMFGLSRADIIGKTLAEDVTPEERESFLSIDKQVISNGIESVSKESLTVRNNKIRIISTKKTRYVDEKGVKFLIGVIRDITDQKKSEKEILALGNRNTLIIETLLDGFILADTTGKILDANPSYVNMIGYTLEELLTMNINQLESALNQKQIDERINEMVSKGFARFESNHKKKNGEIINLDVNTFTMQVNEQFVVAAFVKDITEGKKAEKALKESEEKFSKAFESNLIGKAILDKEKKIIEVNEALANMVGFKRENMLGNTAEEIGLFNFDSQKNLENEEKLWSQFRKNGYASNIELEYLMQSGRQLFILISLEALQLNNEGHVLITIQDITEKKDVEEELEQHRNNLEELVEIRTEEVNSKNMELERMNKIFIGRELKMKELKSIIKELQKKNDK